VLLLVWGEGMEPGEAAVSLGLPPETLRKRLQRARERLAAELELAAEPRAKAG
jgi:RNA polymerase sigma-70 factor (ECF subfamily)